MMHTSTIRISHHSKILLESLAKTEHLALSRLIDKIVEEYRRWQLLHQANKAFAQLRADPKAWKEEQIERSLWDTTLSDGMEDKTWIHPIVEKFG